jgi:CO/xanthine dehydrogenase Mo-binding subunit
VIELPASLVDNPRLDQWVAFSSAGRITVRTGKVEIGQGVLTAMLQIAAEEIDVATARITLQSGDTDFAPNEGYTSGSQSIQAGGLALRLACAEIRLLFLEQAAQKLGVSLADVSVADGSIACRGDTTAENYWTLADSVDLSRRATGRRRPKQVTITVLWAVARSGSTWRPSCPASQSLFMTLWWTACCMLG